MPEDAKNYRPSHGGYPGEVQAFRDYTDPSAYKWTERDQDRWSLFFHRAIQAGYNVELARLFADAELALDGKF